MSEVMFPPDLEPWDGYCLELVNLLLCEHTTGEILWVEPRTGPWRYHAVLVLDGVTHDPWHPDVRLPPAKYVATVFGRGTPWEMNPGADDDD